MAPFDIYLFEDCNDSNNLFRYENIPGTLTEGYVYNINGGDGFNGYAKVITYAEEGPIYSASGVVFVGGPTQCPTPTNTQTPTSSPTPTPTPTPSVTEQLIMEPMLLSYTAPTGCTYSSFCFGTTLPSLSGYSGNYTSGSTYNNSPVYSGDGTSVGVIYYYSGVSESYWCLSNTIGGTCYLRGSSPCTSDCPDISGNLFTTGLCPTPTATAANCNAFDFNAYFDCDYEPVPTPTPSVACDDVNFNVYTVGVTPTPSATSFTCQSTGVDFSMSAYTPSITPTLTLTPSVTLTKTVDVQGKISFTMLDEVFSCVSVKVLVDCNDGTEYYTSDALYFQTIPVVIGMIMFASINGKNVCVNYERDDTNISSNSNVDNIFNLYSSCEYCSTLPTPTPTVTSTPSTTPASTLTPTPTPSTSPDAPGSTPRATTTQTPTMTSTPQQTSTMTSTPTPTPNWVYVYESCSPIKGLVKKTQVIQKSQITSILVNQVFQDVNGDCWVYNGKFAQNYIAPSTVFTITNNGNYFVNANTTKVYNDCTTCQTPSTSPSPRYTYTWSYITNNDTCTLSSDINVWSYDIISNGWYTFDGKKYYLRATSHSSYSIQISNSLLTVSTACAPKYSYYQSTVDVDCIHYGYNPVWSYDFISTSNYYIINGTKYYITVPVSPHSTYTTQINLGTATLSSCDITYYNVSGCAGGTGVLKYNGPDNLSPGIVVRSTNGNCYTILSSGASGPESSGTYSYEVSDCMSC
jgi:hypothetical protein